MHSVTLCILIEIFSHLHAKGGKKALMIWNSGIFIGHFLSDGTASVAVKRLSSMTRKASTESPKKQNKNKQIKAIQTGVQALCNAVCQVLLLWSSTPASSWSSASFPEWLAPATQMPLNQSIISTSVLSDGVTAYRLVRWQIHKSETDPTFSIKEWQFLFSEYFKIQTHFCFKMLAVILVSDFWIFK